MNFLKRPFEHPSRSVTPEPPPDITKHPKLALGSTPTSSRSTNDVDIHTSVLSPQPIAATKAPPLGQESPVPQVDTSTPGLVSIGTQRSVKFPAAGNSTPHAKWTGLKRFASVLSPSTKAFDFGPLKSAVDGIAESIAVYEAAAEAHEEYESLRNQLDWLFHDLAGRFGESTPPVMRPSIMNLAKGIEQELLFLRKKEHRKTPNRYIEALDDGDRVLGCYRRIHALLERLALNANVNIWMLVDDQATSQRLERLSPSHAAWYNSAESEEIFRDECTPDTRLEVLERFRLWQNGNESEKIYWLNGMAGTGKTTLAYTLCKQLEDGNRLAANFFCARQLPSCRDTKLILPTIAYQLANFSYPFRYALSQILDQNRDVHTRRISEQFDKLLYKPLHEVQHSLPYGLVIVIDGLDECENDRGVGELLDALFNHMSDIPIKFFLTSRPEQAIRRRMLRREGNRDRFELHLHELGKGVVREDIKKYLQAGLKHPDFTLPNEHLEILIERSGVLFIYAATVVRYIGAYDFSRSDDRLMDVLEATTGSNDSDQAISSLYNVILNRAFDDPRLIPRERDEMQLVLGTVICAQEPLTIRAMAGVVELGERSVHAALGLLRSVLNVHKDETITTLHKSFPDHMLDPTRSLIFCCHAQKRHGWLARRCLDLISTLNPPFNMGPSYVLDDDVVDPNQKAKQHFPEELLYASRYWALHQRQADQSDDILNGPHKLSSFLLVRQFIWLEVMGLTEYLRLEVEKSSLVNFRESDKRIERSLVTEAAAVAISLKQYHLALEWLEQGSSILWGRTLRLQTPYDYLYTGDLAMAKKLQDVLYWPVPRPAGRAPARDGGPLHESARKHHRFTQRRTELLHFAQLLPRIEDSLHPPTASELVGLVQDGAAVIVNLDASRCDALVMRAGSHSITHVPLAGFSLKKAEQAADCFRPQHSSHSFNEADIQPEVTTENALAMLWYDVVKPVLDHLGISQIFLACDLPRITWCTTGPLSFLPLHAAGDYRNANNVLANMAISSYTPSLSSLSQHTSSPGTFSGILAVTPRFLYPHSSASDELNQVRIQAGTFPFTLLDAGLARTNIVLKAMEAHSWVHFVCSNPNDPHNIALPLDDGGLSLTRIAQNPMKNAQLAFLSLRDDEYSESLHDRVLPAAGLLTVGYPGVIATIWPVNNQDAEIVAGKVYECLLQGGVPDSRKAAKALHKAVASLRETIGVHEFRRWIPYVHFGL